MPVRGQKKAHEDKGENFDLVLVNSLVFPKLLWNKRPWSHSKSWTVASMAGYGFWFEKRNISMKCWLPCCCYHKVSTGIPDNHPYTWCFSCCIYIHLQPFHQVIGVHEFPLLALVWESIAITPACIFLYDSIASAFANVFWCLLAVA